MDFVSILNEMKYDWVYNLVHYVTQQIPVCLINKNIYEIYKQAKYLFKKYSYLV